MRLVGLIQWLLGIVECSERNVTGKNKQACKTEERKTNQMFFLLGFSLGSREVKTTPADTEPPIAGSSSVIAITNVTTTSITLSWTKATDNLTPQNQLQYKVVSSLANNIDDLTAKSQFL